MVKLVLLHKADSKYGDVPEARYDFPKAYLKAVTEGVDDWAVYYEPVKAGPKGYFAVAKIQQVIPNPAADGRYLALIAPGTFLEFDAEVPRLIDGRPIESALAHPDGTTKSGGAQQSAVRRLPEAEFARIVNLGLPQDLERQEATPYDPVQPAFTDQPAPFERPVIERLTRRAYRDVAFRRKVRAAYDFRCHVGAAASQRRRPARGASRPYPPRGRRRQRRGPKWSCAIGHAPLDVRPRARGRGGG